MYVRQGSSGVAPSLNFRVEALDDQGRRFMKKLMKNKSGATAIEYGLIAALIAVVIITAAGALGNKVSANFNTVTAAMH